jgi:hypothetical protein
MEQILVPVFIVFVAIVLSLLVDYRTLFAVWVFTIPFFRNLVNIRTPVSDFKLSYLLFIPVFLGALYDWRRGRQQFAHNKKEYRRLLIALAILLGVTVLAMLVSPAPLSGIRVVARICYVIAIVLVSISVLRNHKDTVSLLKVWSVSLSSAIALGFVFYLTGALPPGYIVTIGQGPITVESVNDSLLDEYDIGESVAVKRYTLGFGNLYDDSADFTILGLFLFTGWALSRTGVSSMLPWFGSALCGVALLLTYTRGAWLCCTLGLFIVAYTYKQLWRILFLLGGIVGLLAFYNPGKINDRAITVDPSIISRVARLTTAADIISRHPVAGAGPGVFTQQLTEATESWRFLDPDSDVTAHSAVVEYLGEQGAVGLLALFWLFGCYLYLGWKVIKRFRRERKQMDVITCTVLAVFAALTLHSFVLPAFEDSIWLTYALGYALAVQSLYPSPSADQSRRGLARG